jgi:hypothetical protein
VTLLDDERAEVAEVAGSHASADTFDDTSPLAHRPRPEPLLAGYARWFLAICTLASATLHVVAMADHVDHHPTLGRAFLTVALLQVAWGALVVRTRSRVLLVAGALGTVVVSLVWVVSRTKGISWFPGLEAVEPIGWRDLANEAFQLLAIVAAVALLVPRRLFAANDGSEPLDPRPIAAMAVIAGLVVTFVYGATHGVVHH